MKQEEKNLFRTLTSGLEWGLKIMVGETVKSLQLESSYTTNFQVSVRDVINNKYSRPILRPMSSLTKPIKHGGEEVDVLKKIEDVVGRKMYVHQNFDNELLFKGKNECYMFMNEVDTIMNILDKYHFNWRNLPEDMYKKVNELKVNPYE